MNSILEEFGKKIAGRWAGAVLFPGVLLVACLATGILLGQGRALQWEIGFGSAVRLAGSATGPQLFSVAVLALLFGYAAGLLALCLRGLVVRVAVSARPRKIIAIRASRARSRNPNQPEPYLPARLTVIGDIWRNVGKRVEVQYGLDLLLVWPRIWILVSEDVRKVVAESFQAYREATLVISWSLLFLASGAVWWTSAVGGALALVVGFRRSGASARGASQIIESVVDANQVSLATSVGVALPQGRMTPNEGSRVNNILRKRSVVD